MLHANIRIGEHRGNIAPPPPPAPPAPTLSPALHAALAPLRAYRAAHPFPSRATLPSVTPEQFAARAAIWQDDYLDQLADERRAETIADLEREAAQIGGAQ